MNIISLLVLSGFFYYILYPPREYCRWHTFFYNIGILLGFILSICQAISQTDKTLSLIFYLFIFLFAYPTLFILGEISDELF